MPDLPGWAKDYIGLKFKERGRDRDGCDCWGLVRLIAMNELGFNLPSFGEEYESTYKGTEVVEALDVHGIKDGHWIQIEEGAEKLGTFILMNGLYLIDGVRHRAPMHVGVVVASGRMIHIEEGIDSVLCKYREDRYTRKRIVGFYNHRDLK